MCISALQCAYLLHLGTNSETNKIQIFCSKLLYTYKHKTINTTFNNFIIYYSMTNRMVFFIIVILKIFYSNNSKTHCFQQK